jgi:hypothetical protein
MGNTILKTTNWEVPPQFKRDQAAARACHHSIME